MTMNEDGGFKVEENSTTNSMETNDPFCFPWKAHNAGIKKAANMFVFGM